MRALRDCFGATLRAYPLLRKQEHTMLVQILPGMRREPAIRVKGVPGGFIAWADSALRQKVATPSGMKEHPCSLKSED
jgi:hypothetical protein